MLTYFKHLKDIQFERTFRHYFCIIFLYHSHHPLKSSALGIYEWYDFS